MSFLPISPCFVDWIAIQQKHNGLNDLNGGYFMETDSDDKEKWKTAKHLPLEGSHSTSVLVRSFAGQVEVRGNVGRWCRPDNVFIVAAIAAVAAIKVLPAFTRWGSVGATGGTTTGFAPNDPMHAFCIDNPQASICKEQTAGKTTVGTAALSGLYTAGTLNNSKTFGSVVGDFKTRFLASGIGAGAGGFFNVTATAGACPTWSSNVPMFGVMTFDFYCGSTFQNLLPWMRSVILIIFSVIAFRIGLL